MELEGLKVLEQALLVEEAVLLKRWPKRVHLLELMAD
jgi:hypothetical protein